MRSSGEEFWNLEPIYNNWDIARETGNRVVSNWRDIALTFIPAAKNTPQIVDLDAINDQKVKFAIQERLRTLGPNSVFEHTIVNKNGLQMGTYKMEYQIDEKGNESFNESYNLTYR